MYSVIYRKSRLHHLLQILNQTLQQVDQFMTLLTMSWFVGELSGYRLANIFNGSYILLRRVLFSVNIHGN